MMKINGIGKWADKTQPFIIAGPCSAESEEQLSITVEELVGIGIHTIRAGVWKPRTRPTNFEGAGEAALEWITGIKDRFNVKFAIEVATGQHVEKAIEYGMDLLWIGARTTANPFAVQEVVEALRGVDVPVLVKNPINPDIGLWLGAIERLTSAGLSNIAAIHRGFSSFQRSSYRFPPTWHIAIELKSRIPEIPLICDPSHMAGNRDMILELSQKAMDMDYDGLMIETHHAPDQALSDAQQQITPSQLKQVLDSLQLRTRDSRDVHFLSQLESLREKIDHIDREMLEALSARMQIVEEIGLYKKENNVTVFQLERWQEILRSRPEWGRLFNLDSSFVETLYKLIHDESIRSQTEIMNRETLDS